MADGGGKLSLSLPMLWASAGERVARGDAPGGEEQARVQRRVRGGCGSPELARNVVEDGGGRARNSLSLGAERERQAMGKVEETGEIKAQFFWRLL